MQINSDSSLGAVLETLKPVAEVPAAQTTQPSHAGQSLQDLGSNALAPVGFANSGATLETQEQHSSIDHTALMDSAAQSGDPAEELLNMDVWSDQNRNLITDQAFQSREPANLAQQLTNFVLDAWS